MKFIPIEEINNTPIDIEILSTECKSARTIGKIYLGEQFLFVKHGFKFYYIPYTNIHRAFRRIKAVPTRICCGKGELRLEYIVLCSKKEELCEIDLPDEKASTGVLEDLKKRFPDIKIGKKD